MLLLLRQLFKISRAVNIGVYVGIAIAFVLYVSVIVVSVCYSEALRTISYNSSRGYEALRWGVAQSVLASILDIYIFILPLTMIFRLQMSPKRKTQVAGVFSVAILGIVASILNLAYRIIASSDSDVTYYTGAMASTLRSHASFILTAFVRHTDFFIIELYFS
ncbi:hypothetical protein GGR57DRAFT_464304 [Xylariaceae sp. FL1272]|nr:hypothetical protein GGR57DRAFT_464304 [Xylariaceae sp. FL1272]